MRAPGRGIGRAIEIGISIGLACTFAVAGAQAHEHFAKAGSPSRRPYAVSSTAGAHRPVLDVRGAAAGDTGWARTTVSNAGTRRARILAQRIVRRTSALDRYLTLSVYDETTKRCLFPVRRSVRARAPWRPRMPRARPSGPCTQRGAWSRLPTLYIPPRPVGPYVRRGVAELVWRRDERHSLLVRWGIDPAAPSSAAGATSAYVVRWRAARP